MADFISNNIPKVIDILKTEGIIRFQTSQTLSQALASLTTSHDAAFVFDDDNEFVGVVSPYYLFSNRSYKAESKLKSCVKMPPKLQAQMSLSKAARAMIESKIHYLPVVDDKGNFIGIATIRRLLEAVIARHILNNDRIIFSQRPLITTTADMTLSQAISLMAREKIARLPIVNAENRLIGIITQYDLRGIVKNTETPGKQDRRGEKHSRLDQPISQYMITLVKTVNQVPTFVQAVNIMNDQGIGSLIVVDRQNHPISIITKKDLLQTIAETKI